MKKSCLKKFCLNAATACMCLLLALPPGLAEELRINDKFPDLSQYDLVGKLPDKLEGKVVLVDFWASWCTPCRAAFPVLAELHQTYGSKGLTIVAVSVDETDEAMEHFVKKNPAPFTVVRDPQQKLVARANVASMPTSFLIDAQGRVRFIHRGFKGEETRKKYIREIEELLPGSSNSAAK